MKPILHGAIGFRYTNENLPWIENVKKIDGQWKVAHYVLSIAVPNDLVDELVELKKETDNTLLRKAKNKLIKKGESSDSPFLRLSDIIFSR